MEKSNLAFNSESKNIADFSTAIIQSVDKSGIFLYCNETWSRTLGYSYDEITTLTIWDVLCKESHKDYENIMKMVEQGIEPGHQELQFLTKRNEEILLSGIISILKDDFGYITGTTEFFKLAAYIDTQFDVMVSAREIKEDPTSLIHEETYGGNMLLGLEDQDSPINRFLDSIYDLVFFKDVHGIYRGCNSNFADLMNLPKHKILGRDDYELYPKETADMFVSKDEQILRDLTPRKNEEWVTKTDGTRSFIETLKTPYWGPDKELIGFLGISRDITERKLAEERLAENEMWLNIYFTQSLSAKFFMTLSNPVKWDEATDKEAMLQHVFDNMKMNRVNPAMMELYGESEETIMEKDSAAIYFTPVEEGRDQWNILLDQSHYHGTTRHVKRDGSVMWINGDYTCLYDAQGRLMGIFGNQRDMTKEVLIEEETRSRERYLRTVLETTRDGFYTLDENMIIRDVNDAYCRMSGYTREEILGTHISQHTTIKGENSILHKAKDIHEKGSELFESRHAMKDGTIFDVEISVSSSGPEDKMLINFIRDITERKQLESYFLIEKDMFKNTLHSAADAVISTDPSGRVIIMNGMAESLTGWSQEEASGRFLEEIVCVLDGKGHRLDSIVLDCIKEKSTIELSKDYKLVSRNGSEVFIELNAAPITGSENKITGAVVMFKDVTRRREEMKNIEDLSFRDALTGLFNRRHLDETLSRLGDDLNLPLTIMVIDVNGLKLTNDAFGHSMGDALLKAVARICKDVTRQGDIICRTGGDEFVILLPNSDRSQAKALKDRIVSLASKTTIDSLTVSLAIGYSVMKSCEEKFEDVFAEADNNMYRNKLKYGKHMKKKTIDKLLTKLNRKNTEASIHTKEVSRYAEEMGIALKLPVAEVENLKMAGLLHDIGKVMVPSEILVKSERLTERETLQVRKHSEIGYQLLKEVDEYKGLADIVLSHHEWWDGSGYPRKLKGEEIPLAARIISIADSYETMTGKRSYTHPMTKVEAIKELRDCAGVQFDPELVEIFIREVLLG